MLVLKKCYASSHGCIKFFSRCHQTIVEGCTPKKRVRYFCNSPPIMKVLNVAEKNDAAKNIAGFLSNGNSTRREGRSKFNKIYEFQCNVRGQRAQMVMTSVSGHLLALDFDTRYKGWKSCNPLVLFDAPVRKYCPDNYKAIKETLEREIQSCQMLIIWTDCDREGENIGFEIINVCKAKKANIDVYRAKFSEITQRSISRAINSLERPNKLLSDAVEVRSELDLRIGAAFTRFQTLRLQQVFPTRLSQQLISYGSCQFPTLGFVVERYKAIERFIPESFWKISVSHTDAETTVDFLWKRVRLFDELACQVFLDLILENQTAVVEKVVSKPKSKWRPMPLDTIELEKQGSKKLKINAKETMRIAERLYTQGFISYPRTETNIFPKEMNLQNLIQMQTQDNRWGAFAQRVYDSGPNPRQGKKSDQAHPPIHPTKYADNLHGDEGRVYEFIVRHFLACCSKDAQGQETIVDVDINGEKFVASGLQIIERNYLEVYPYEKWSSKEILPYREGQEFQPSKIEMTDGETSSPKPLTEADLIALMEKHGIGTDATHAEHIETIKSRSYVGLDNIYFLPGELGLGLVDGYDSMGFAMSKPNLRAELEADLQRIADGLRNPQDVLSEQVAKYRHVFTIALQQAEKIDTALSKYLNEAVQPVLNDPAAQAGQAFKKVSSCVLCGSDMILKQKRDNAGYFISCTGYPDCRNAIWLPNSVEHCDVSEETCSVCNSYQKLKFRFKRGSYLPIYPDVYEGCVGGCDPNFLEALDIVLQRQQNNGGAMNRNADFRQNARDNSQQDGFSSSFSDSGYISNSSSTASASRAQENTLRNGSGFGGGSIQSSNRSNSSGAPRQSNKTISSRSTDIGADAIVCKCNIDAVKLTVRKDGPNQGREFYKCGGSRDASCDFFMWADDGTAGTSSRTNTTAPTPRISNFMTTHGGSSNTSNSSNFMNNPDDPEEVVTCSCREPARLLTVLKEGPNKGRQFYSCPKPRESQCSFFLWHDGNERSGSSSNSNSSAPGRWNGGANSGGNWRGNSGDSGGGGAWGGGRGGSGSGARGRGKKPSAPGGARAKRKCGNCGQEGHIRTKCPNQ